MQDFMPHHSHTAIFTFVSGVVEGIGKALTEKSLICDYSSSPNYYVLYAAAAVIAGYVVKKVLDNLS